MDRVIRLLAVAAFIGLSALVITRADLLVRTFPGVAAVVSSVLVELTNTDRTGAGLGTLTVSETLTKVAQMKANDMATKGYFAHVSPEGLTPWHWFKEGGYKFIYAGENLAVDFNESADVERAWMNSPTHRANIVGTNFQEIGIAVATGTFQGRPAVFVAQVFGTPALNAQGASGDAKASSPEPLEVKDLTLNVPAATPAVAVAVKPVPPVATSTKPVASTTAPVALTTTPTPSAVLGNSAGAYLQNSVKVPLWHRIVTYFK